MIQAGRQSPKTVARKTPMKQELLRLLRCPRTLTELVHDGERLVNTDPSTRLAYPIRQNIPVLVPEEGTPLSEDEWSAAMKRQGHGAG